MKIIRKSTSTPEAWALRMAQQRARRAKPGARAAENARARELWPKSGKKARQAEYERKRRAMGCYVAGDKRKRDKTLADPARRARYLATQRACYWKKREHYLAHVRSHRDRVTPSYAASILKLPVAAVPAPAVELVRAYLTLKRELRKPKP